MSQAFAFTTEDTEITEEEEWPRIVADRRG